jgi:hypothetical protein
LRYAIRRVQVKQDGLKLNGTYKRLFCADDVNILGRSVHTVKKNTVAVVVASKEIGKKVKVSHNRPRWPKGFRVG